MGDINLNGWIPQGYVSRYWRDVCCEWDSNMQEVPENHTVMYCVVAEWRRLILWL